MRRKSDDKWKNKEIVILAEKNILENLFFFEVSYQQPNIAYQPKHVDLDLLRLKWFKKIYKFEN